MDLDHQIPLVFGHRREHAVAHDTGIVDDAVHVAKCVDAGIDDRLCTTHRGDVVDARNRLAAGLDDLVDDAFGAGTVDVIDDHVRAFGGEIGRASGRERVCLYV